MCVCGSPTFCTYDQTTLTSSSLLSSHLELERELYSMARHAWIYRIYIYLRVSTLAHGGLGIPPLATLVALQESLDSHHNLIELKGAKGEPHTAVWC